jgi:hypothetical protein
MSPVGRERQALNSIQSVLGHTDPKLASLLATFSRLASSEEMPPHERVRSPLRHPPYRRRSRPRREKAPYRSRGLQPAAVLTRLLTSVTLITVAVILSNGGPAASPHAFGICGRLAPGRRAAACAATRTLGARPPGIPLAGLAAIRHDPQDTHRSDIDLRQRRSPSAEGPASPGGRCRRAEQDDLSART